MQTLCTISNGSLPVGALTCLMAFFRCFQRTGDEALSCIYECNPLTWRSSSLPHTLRACQRASH